VIFRHSKREDFNDGMEPSNPIILGAQADFAVNLLRESVHAHPNASVIISPVSVAIALSMVYAGARDKTADEIAAVIAKGMLGMISHRSSEHMHQS
jgi:serine protease inhibitor